MDGKIEKTIWYWIMFKPINATVWNSFLQNTRNKLIIYYTKYNIINIYSSDSARNAANAAIDEITPAIILIAVKVLIIVI